MDTTNNNDDTPRTNEAYDNALLGFKFDHGVVLDPEFADFARTLERELADARKRIAELTDLAENAEARAELEANEAKEWMYNCSKHEERIAELEAQVTEFVRFVDDLSPLQGSATNAPCGVRLSQAAMLRISQLEAQLEELRTSHFGLELKYNSATNTSLELTKELAEARKRIAELEAKNRDCSNLAHGVFEALCEMGFATGETLGEFIDRIKAMPKRIAELEALVSSPCALRLQVQKVLPDYALESIEFIGRLRELAEHTERAEAAHIATQFVLVRVMDNEREGRSLCSGLPVEGLKIITAARAAVAQADKEVQP